MIAARGLIDDVPGNIGLLADDAEVVRLRFAESDGVLPSDAAGNLLDLAPPSAHVAPASVDSWTGKGREFDPGAPTALVALDASGRDTLATRDATIIAIMSLDLAAASGAGTVYCRGIGGSAAEYYGLGLELENQGGPDHGTIDARLFWSTTGGVLKTQAAGAFRWPGDGVPFLFAATRRWVSTTEVAIAYYVDGQLIAESTSVDGDIGGGTTGTTSIGARRTAGTWGDYLSGVLDELQVLERACSAEEIAALWARLAVHQPQGVDRLRALAPPGAPWGVDRGSRIARLQKAAGQGLGLVAATAESLLANWLPDRAGDADLARWESLLGVAARGSDSLQVRRDRVVGLLRRENGYSLPKLREALALAFDQDAADVEIVEFTADVEDDFTTLSTERWRAEPSARWSIVSGKLRLAALAADDARWDASTRSPIHIRTPLYACSAGREAAARLGVIAQVNVADYTIANPTDVLVGLFLYSFATGKAFWFGVWKNGAQYDVAHATFDGTSTSSFATLASNIGTANLRLRIRASATVAGEMALEWGAGAATFDDLLDSATVTADVAADYVGLAALQDPTSSAASIGGALTVEFDDFLVRAPNGERAFHWYAYRDTGAPGEPDMIGAQRLVERIKPAHTNAAAITSLSLLCDDPASGCDRGPMGGV